MTNIKAYALLFAALLGTQAFAAGVDEKKTGADRIIFGVSSSSDAKEVIFNTGDGASNAKMAVDNSRNISIATDGSITLDSNAALIGDGLSSDKTLKFDIAGSDDPGFKWDSAEQKIKFSNNGADFKSLGSGSGSGSGINALSDFNADLETDGPADWTASSAPTLTSADSGSNKLFLVRSGVFNASATSQTVDSEAISVSSGDFMGLASSNGYASCYFKTTATDYKIQAYDGSNVLAERTIPALASAQEIGVAFPWPSSGSVQLRLVSASDAADLAFDNCFLGSSNIMAVSQPAFIGSARIPATASCSWTVTNTAFTAFGTSATCPGPTVDLNPGPGTIQTTDDNLPQFTVNNLPPGIYRVTMSGAIQSNGANNSVSAITISDGTSTSGRHGNEIGASGNPVAAGLKIVGYFVYTATGNRTFALQGAATTGSVNLANTSGQGGLFFSLDRFPTSQEQAVRPDQVAWMVNANIGGANPTVGTAAVTSYTALSNSGLDMVLGSGSLGARIPCSSTNPSTGLTCSAGDETIGVNFTAPMAGFVEACFAFGIQYTCDGTATACTSAQPTFQVIETGNADQTIVQEGGAKVQVGASAFGSTIASSAYAQSVKVCGTFYFASAGEKTLRLMHETPANARGMSLLADRSATNGQRDIHVTVRPTSQANPAPLIVGSVTSRSTGLERIERASLSAVCTAGTCTLSSSTPGISAVTFSATGRYNVAFAASTFSAAPVCFYTPFASTGSVSVAATQGSGTITSTTHTIAFMDAAGSFVNAAFDVLCMGPR
jgi:hypothetical protein